MGVLWGWSVVGMEVLWGCCRDGVLWGWGVVGMAGVVWMGVLWGWGGRVVGVGDVVGMGMLWGGGGGVMGLVTHVWSRRAYPRPWRGTRSG